MFLRRVAAKILEREVHFDKHIVSQFFQHRAIAREPPHPRGDELLMALDEPSIRFTITIENRLDLAPIRLIHGDTIVNAALAPVNSGSRFTAIANRSRKEVEQL